jgi:hypothetical protein
MTKKTNAQ